MEQLIQDPNGGLRFQRLFTAREQYELAYRMIRILEHGTGSRMYNQRYRQFWGETPEISETIKGNAQRSYVLSFRRARGLVRGIHAQARRSYACMLYTRRTGKFAGRLTYYGMASVPDASNTSGSSLAAGWEY